MPPMLYYREITLSKKRYGFYVKQGQPGFHAIKRMSRT